MNAADKGHGVERPEDTFLTMCLDYGIDPNWKVYECLAGTEKTAAAKVRWERWKARAEHGGHHDRR